MAENGGWFREYSDGTNKRRYLLAEPGFCFVMLYPFHSTCAFPEPGIEPGTCDFRVRRASHSAAIRRPSPAIRPFEIVSSSGEIYITGEVDYEKNPNGFELLISARDQVCKCNCGTS